MLFLELSRQLALMQVCSDGSLTERPLRLIANIVLGGKRLAALSGWSRAYHCFIFDIFISRPKNFGGLVLKSIRRPGSNLQIVMHWRTIRCNRARGVHRTYSETWLKVSDNDLTRSQCLPGDDIS